MALTECKECNAKISDKAKTCPKCGCPDPFKAEEAECIECKELIPKESDVCPECGHPEPFEIDSPTESNSTSSLSSSMTNDSSFSEDNNKEKDDDNCPEVDSLHCSICKKSRLEVAKLIKSEDDSCICNECVYIALEAFEDKNSCILENNDFEVQCNFCSSSSKSIFQGVSANICSDCTKLCEEIVAGELEKDRYESETIKEENGEIHSDLAPDTSVKTKDDLSEPKTEEIKIISYKDFIGQLFTCMKKEWNKNIETEEFKDEDSLELEDHKVRAAWLGFHVGLIYLVIGDATIWLRLFFLALCPFIFYWHLNLLSFAIGIFSLWFGYNKFYVDFQGLTDEVDRIIGSIGALALAAILYRKIILPPVVYLMHKMGILLWGFWFSLFAMIPAVRKYLAGDDPTRIFT